MSLMENTPHTSKSSVSGIIFSSFMLITMLYLIEVDIEKLFEMSLCTAALMACRKL